MLKQRFITILFLIPLLLALIYFAPINIFIGVAFIFALIGMFEWMPLIPIYRASSKGLFLILWLLVIFLSSKQFNYWLIASVSSWIFIAFIVISYPGTQKIWNYPFVPGVLALVYLAVFFHALLGIYNHFDGKNLLLYILCLIWATDIGAYISGKCYGKHKLLPKVSPGKTFEGALGGLFFAMIVTVCGYYIFKPYDAYSWFIIALITILISMLGDLFISMLKRRCKVKDTGTIFPGHGGMLDRIDSLIAALPLFYGALLYTGF